MDSSRKTGDWEARVFGHETVCGMDTNPKNKIAAHLVGPFIAVVKVAVFALKFIFDILVLLLIGLSCNCCEGQSIRKEFKHGFYRLGVDIEGIVRNIIKTVPVVGLYIANEFSNYTCKIADKILTPENNTDLIMKAIGEKIKLYKYCESEPIEEAIALIDDSIIQLSSGGEPVSRELKDFHTLFNIWQGCHIALVSSQKIIPTYDPPDPLSPFDKSKKDKGFLKMIKNTVTLENNLLPRLEKVLSKDNYSLCEDRFKKLSNIAATLTSERDVSPLVILQFCKFHIENDFFLYVPKNNCESSLAHLRNLVFLHKSVSSI